MCGIRPSLSPLLISGQILRTLLSRDSRGTPIMDKRKENVCRNALNEIWPPLTWRNCLEICGRASRLDWECHLKFDQRYDLPPRHTYVDSTDILQVPPSSMS